MLVGMTGLRRKLETMYRRLLAAYGAQGWWPLSQCVRGDASGYHPGNYALPDDPSGRFEVAVGAVLTQNTAWKNAEKAIHELRRRHLLGARAISRAESGRLKAAIRSSGYFNQKAKKLKCLARLFLEKKWLSGTIAVRREELLEVWGIGEETADSILLYAFREPYFVVDAYAKRLLFRLSLIAQKASYRHVQDLFQGNLPRDAVLYNEYHALMVEHAKRHCRKTPRCAGCPLGRMCRYENRDSQKEG